MKKNKKVPILLPKQPRFDKILAAAILILAGKASGTRIVSMVPHEKWQMKIDGIPIGLNVDYRKIDYRSYATVIVSEYDIPRTPEIQRLVELANKNVRHQTEKGSFSDIISTTYSAQYWETQHGGPKQFTDEQIVEEGVHCVSDMIQFSKLGLQRDNWSIEILQKEVQKVGANRVPRLTEYLRQINSGLKIDGDIIELLTARKKLRGEEEAQRFAGQIVRIYSLANQVFQEAMQICREQTILKKTEREIVVATNTDNPVFLGAANVWFKQPKPAIVIQQFLTGHVNIFFRSDIAEKVSDSLTAVLREEELKLCKKDELGLSKERESPGVPDWFYIKSPFGIIMLLNASVSGNESIAATKIPLLEIINWARTALL